MTGKLMKKAAASFLGFLVWTLPLAAQHSPHVLGTVVGSTGAELGGVPLPNSGTILNHDVLTTGRQGKALLEFSPSELVTVYAHARLRFYNQGNRVVADMAAGSLAVQSIGRGRVVVAISRFRVVPASRGKTVYLVKLAPDGGLLIAARQGRVTVTEGRRGPRRFVLEGHYASIAGAPGHSTRGESKSSRAPTRTWHLRSLSSRASLGVAAAIGAGAAGALAIPLFAGSRVASPTQP